MSKTFVTLAIQIFKIQQLWKTLKHVEQKHSTN